jgi:hypothetical protein
MLFYSIGDSPLCSEKFCRVMLRRISGASIQLRVVLFFQVRLVKTGCMMAYNSNHQVLGCISCQMTLSLLMEGVCFVVQLMPVLRLCHQRDGPGKTTSICVSATPPHLNFRYPSFKALTPPPAWPETVSSLTIYPSQLSYNKRLSPTKSLSCLLRANTSISLYSNLQLPHNQSIVKTARNVSIQ